MSKAKAKSYEVTLRRDVQQVLVLKVDAFSKQEAIDVVESLSDSMTWEIEEHIGTHRPKAELLK